MSEGAVSAFKDEPLPAEADHLVNCALDAAAAEDQFEQSQVAAHGMQAVLARAAEAGEFGGAGDAVQTGERLLISALTRLEDAKAALDRVRLAR